MKRDVAIIVLSAVNVFMLIFGVTWCYCLEQNQKVMLERIELYQQINYEHNEKQDKDIRIVQQDIMILQRGYE